MGNGQGLALERPGLEPVTVAHLSQLGPVTESSLDQLVADETQRERRAVHREREVSQ